MATKRQQDIIDAAREYRRAKVYADWVSVLEDQDEAVPTSSDFWYASAARWESILFDALEAQFGALVLEDDAKPTA